MNNNKIYLLAPVALAMMLPVACSCNKNNDKPVEDLTQWVNPMIGTDFTGNTYPGVQAPFGMVQLSPDNGLPGWDRIAGYYYPDSTIAGFSHTHLSGTGAGDLYDISFMPVMLPAVESPGPLGVYSMFSHSREEVQAGYYRVHLDSYDIDVELTATPRCGIQRYTFPQGDAAVILNLNKAINWDRTVDTEIQVLDSVTVAGYRFSDGWAHDQRVYFATRFSQPFDSVSIQEFKINNGKNQEAGTGLVATFNYPTTAGQQLTVTTALSGVSVEGALANLAAEAPDNDFDKYYAEAKEAWQNELSRIEIDPSQLANQAAEEQRKTVFYTAMYHSMLAPTIYSDVTGEYLGGDRKVHKTEGWTNYSSFSLWDTYRASHPLFTILTPDRATDMARSLIEIGSEIGRLPVWYMWASETDMMIGYHSAPVIVDAILKGLGSNNGVINDEAIQRALQVCVETANNRDYRQLGDYIDLGYVPDDTGEWSMSKTMEYAYDDWCIAQLAHMLGEQDIYDEFMARAAYYLNTYNPYSGFFEPRDRKGNFPSNFVPEEYVEAICESNAWHYRFSVQHDITGLIGTLGGADRFEERLDSMFSYENPDIELPIFSTGMIGQYAQGNEPDHHVPYLYNYTANPWKGADRLHQIMTTLYTTQPDGICGNDDMGQMSAWFVFSSLGFYPVNPVGGIYELGTPLFAHSRIKVGKDKYFTIDAEGLSDDARYIESASLNGKPLDDTSISHGQIMDGGNLTLIMTDNVK